MIQIGKVSSSRVDASFVLIKARHYFISWILSHIAPLDFTPIMKLQSTGLFLSLLSLSSSSSIPKRAPSDSLTIQAGRHVIYAYAGTTPPSDLLSLVTAGKVGGIILFGNNVDADVASNMATFQTAYEQSPAYDGYPLLIVTDQEGGEVRRLPGGPDLSAKAIGQSADPFQAASDAGGQAADACHDAGVNGNLSPVLDVFRTPGDFDDSAERSYSQNASVVGLCGAAFTNAQQTNGVLSTAKHFPGLGSAAVKQNTDEVPVTLDVSLKELRDIDEAPYVDVIKAGVHMVMPSWALYPSLDEERPSGLSSKSIQGELRERLGLKGVTISDAIGAGGLDNFGSDWGQRSVLATQAGMDIILSSESNQTVNEGIVDALIAAVRDGTIDGVAWTNSTQRIVNMRKAIR